MVMACRMATGSTKMRTRTRTRRCRSRPLTWSRLETSRLRWRALPFRTMGSGSRVRIWNGKFACSISRLSRQALSFPSFSLQRTNCDLFYTYSTTLLFLLLPLSHRRSLSFLTPRLLSPRSFSPSLPTPSPSSVSPLSVSTLGHSRSPPSLPTR